MNNILTDKELNKVYTMYADYGPDRLGDFIRMIWKEAYELGWDDGASAQNKLPAISLESTSRSNG